MYPLWNPLSCWLRKLDFTHHYPIPNLYFSRMHKITRNQSFANDGGPCRISSTKGRCRRHCSTRTQISSSQRAYRARITVKICIPFSRVFLCYMRLFLLYFPRWNYVMYDGELVLSIYLDFNHIILCWWSPASGVIAQLFSRRSERFMCQVSLSRPLFQMAIHVDVFPFV